MTENPYNSRAFFCGTRAALHNASKRWTRTHRLGAKMKLIEAYIPA